MTAINLKTEMFLTVFSFRQKALVIGEYIIFTSVGLLSTIGNILIIIVIRKTKEFRHSQYVFKTSIAVSDIIWALVLCFVAATKFQYYFITPYKLHCNPSSIDKNNYKDDKVKNFDCFLLFLQPSSLYNNVWFFLTTFLFRKISLFVSLVSLVFAAGDRYFAIEFPFRYKNLNTNKIAKTLSIVIWILSFLITIITIFTMFYYQGIKPAANAFLQPFDCENPTQIFESVFLFVLFTLLWIFTLLTLISLYNSYKRSLNLNRVVRNKFLAEKQMSLVLILMVVAFTFSLSATLYNHIRFYLCKLHCRECKLYNEMISLYLLSTNSIWNILVYNLMNKKFRLAFKALFKKTN